MQKITPKQAFELLQKIHPSLESIERSSDISVRLIIRSAQTFIDWGALIDWGDETQYPSRTPKEEWRPATPQDIELALINRGIRARFRDAMVSWRNGELIGGFISNDEICFVSRDGTYFQCEVPDRS